MQKKNEVPNSVENEVASGVIRNGTAL